MRYTSQEKKAQKLWAGYESQDEEQFWATYEPLLRKAQQNPAPTRKKRKVKQATVPKAKKKVFHTDFGIFIALCLVTVLAFVLAYIIANSKSEETTMGLFMVIATYLGFTGFVTNALSSSYSFGITPSHLQVYQSIFIKKEKIAWQDIAMVRMSKTVIEDAHGQPSSYLLHIITQQGKEYKYDYALSQAKHWELFDYLRQYVKRVEELPYK